MTELEKRQKGLQMGFGLPTNISSNPAMMEAQNTPTGMRTQDQWNLLNQGYNTAWDQGFRGFGVTGGTPQTIGNTNTYNPPPQPQQTQAPQSQFGGGQMQAQPMPDFGNGSMDFMSRLAGMQMPGMDNFMMQGANLMGRPSATNTGGFGSMFGAGFNMLQPLRNMSMYGGQGQGRIGSVGIPQMGGGMNPQMMMSTPNMRSLGQMDPGARFSGSVPLTKGDINQTIGGGRGLIGQGMTSPNRDNPLGNFMNRTQTVSAQPITRGRMPRLEQNLGMLTHPNYY